MIRRTSALQRGLLLVSLFLMGASALAHQLLWTRPLSLTFGGATPALALVVSAFLLGSAIGTWLGGRIARSLQRFGGLQVAATIASLAAYPALLRLPSLYATLAVDVAAAKLITAFFAVLLLVIPTLLIGAALSAGVHAYGSNLGSRVRRGVALSYGAHTLGAFGGVYLTTVHLMGALGIWGTIIAAACSNLLAVLLILCAMKLANPERTEPAPHEATSKRLLVPGLLALLSGFALLTHEVVLVRLFAIALEGSTIAQGSVVAGLLIGLALGSLVHSRARSPLAHPALVYGALQALGLILVLLLYRSLPWITFQLTVLQSRGTHFVFGLVLLLLVPPSICWGASFPLLFEMASTKPEQTGSAFGPLYASGTLGTLLGALLAGLLVIPRFGTQTAATSALFIEVAIVAVAVGATRCRRTVWGAVLVLLPVVVIAALGSPRFEMFGLPRLYKTETFDQTLEARAQLARNLRYRAEGPTGMVTVLEYGGISIVSLNGLRQGSRSSVPPHPSLDSLLLALLPFAHTEVAQDALVVGLGAGVTAESLLELGVSNVRSIEIEPAMVAAYRKIKSNPQKKNHEVEIGDARHLLLSGVGRAPFDVVVSMPAHPWVAPALFTREYFDLARAHTGPSGIFCTWFGTHRMDEESVARLLRAFVATWPHYVIYDVPEVRAFYLVGAERALPFDRSGWFEKAEKLTVLQPRFSDPAFLAAHVFASGTPDSHVHRIGEMNTDDSAWIETHARFGSGQLVLQHFLPHEYLLPELVEGADSFYASVLEELLGTPSGRLPLSPHPQRLVRAKRTLESISMRFSAAQRSYFSGRIALAEGKEEQARVHLHAASSEPLWKERALKFLATMQPAGPERLAALRSLERSSDVTAAIMEINLEAGLKIAASSTVSSDDDPLGWFFWRATRAGLLNRAERRQFTSEVGPLLLKTNKGVLRQLCVRFATQHRLVAHARLCGRAGPEPRAEALVIQGVIAAGRMDYRRAVEHLSLANRLRPGHRPTMRLLLTALVRAGFARRVSALLEEFRFLGVSELEVGRLLRSARAHGRSSSGP